MFSFLNNASQKSSKAVIAASLGLLGVSAAATPAMADRYDDHRGDRHEVRRVEERRVVTRERVVERCDYRRPVEICRPRYDYCRPVVEVCRPVVEICRPVVIAEPVYRIEYVNVWVPERYEVRTRWVGYGCERRFISERVCIEPGHYIREERKVRVCETPVVDRPIEVGVNFEAR